MTNLNELSDKAKLVLEAATRVFLAHGFSAATTDMIQRDSGVSKSTMYLAFPTKEAMFAAVIEHQCAQMAATMAAIGPDAGDVETILTGLGRAYLSFVLSPPGLAVYRVVIAEAPRFPELSRLFYLAGPRKVTVVVAEHLARAAANGEIDVQSVGFEAAASLFISLIRGEAQMEFLAHPSANPSSAQIDHWVSIAVSTFMRSFAVNQAEVRVRSRAVGA
ncbi:TetR/AcrR family transcriptional regulator [Stenotrophomonas maltophilia]|uniref:TetR/AcrR family transcriptional regulator n=1 Tax=Stenotrophomonas maltophilia TaxID=40324 RepID=UPI002A954F6F|nr:TetR/AcrR family transcriptional regulator [Stenotrophomonas maltophilia]